MFNNARIYMGDIVYIHGMEIYNDRFQDIIRLYDVGSCSSKSECTLLTPKEA